LTPERKQLLKAWLACGLWLGVIAVESTNWLSADNTSRILYPIFHFFTGVDAVRFVVWDYYIRKVGHFCGYFGLSFLFFFAWRATLRRERTWAWIWAIIAFVSTAFVASLDEWHQLYLVSRTGSIHDVLLDSCGAAMAQVLIFWYFLRRSEVRVSTARHSG